jgi:hypothetical protein
MLAAGYTHPNQHETRLHCRAANQLQSGSESSSSSAEYSDNGRSEKRELVIPSPVLLSDADADDDGVNPIQHKLAMAK